MQTTALHCYNLMKLPIEIFIDLSSTYNSSLSIRNVNHQSSSSHDNNPCFCNDNNDSMGTTTTTDTQSITTNSTTTVLHQYARQLQYEIVHKLKTNMVGPRMTNTSPKRRRTLLHPPPNHMPQRSNSTGENSIITVGAVLQLSPYTLLFILDPLLSFSECITFYQRICSFCAPTQQTALSLLLRYSNKYDSSHPRDGGGSTSNHYLWTTNHASTHHQPTTSQPGIARYISTGWDTLDQALRGGLRMGTITELVGGAGTAKTQLAFQATICTAMKHTDHHVSPKLGGGGGGTIWIDTEQKMSLLRLQEMAQYRCCDYHRNTSHSSRPNSTRLVQTVLENVTIHSPSSMAELLTVLDALEGEILDRQDCTTQQPRVTSDDTLKKSTTCLPVRLLVLDSITAPAQREKWSAATQATIVLQIAQQLKRLADQYQFAILIVNQVTSTKSYFTHDEQQPSVSTTQRAALGTAWHHCVTTRIELQQEQFALGHTNPNKVPKRHAKIVKSVNVAPSYLPIPFQVTIQGVVDTQE
jgi:RecA/RadA recombinase